MALAVPGAELPMAGVTMVGVHPTHRRRGILREMMRQQLDAIHERGEPLAGLWASEGAIYQRFGYGWATLGASFEIERSRTAYRAPHEATGSLRLLSVAEASTTLPAIFDALRGQRPGIFARSAAWWPAEFFHDPEHQRHGGSPAQYLLHETDGRPTGYARYRLYPDWDPRGPKSAVEVLEVMAATPGATLDIWRYLFDVDLVATIRGRNQPVDHPILLALAEPRRLGWTVSDALWLRLVDLAAALGGRRWEGSDALVLEVADAYCAWNTGIWQLEVMDGTGHLTRTERAPDLRIAAADLATLYLGAWRAADLARAGRLDEVTPGATARFDRLLQVAAAPWCPQTF
jgi:predicted acetyltransferase